MMKVYRVTTEHDGEHHKEGHLSVVDISRQQKYIAASNMETLLEYIKNDRNDEDLTIVGIEEVIASIQMPPLYTETSE